MNFIKKYRFLFAWGIVLIVVTVFNKSLHYQWDLTQDKRFTVSDVSKQVLSGINDTITVDVFLQSGINPGFNRLHQSCYDLLFTLKRSSKHFKINLIEVDKLKSNALENFKAKVERFQFIPINVVEEDNKGKLTQKSVFPYALLSTGKYSTPINLLENDQNKSSEENLNESVQLLEYKFLDAIRIVTSSKDRRVAFLEGNGELTEAEVYDITESLSQYYSVDRGSINGLVGVLDAYEAIILASPKKAFSEEQKFVLDQYIMQGGKVLWLLNSSTVSADSLRSAGKTLAFHNDLNLEDMLFTYGVSVNADLILDLQCAEYPINTATAGSPAKFTQVPWQYAPLFSSLQTHPITKNLKPVKGEFVSSLRPLEAKQDVKSTVLLRTSAQTNVLKLPVEVDLSMLEEGLDSRYFNLKYIPTAVLLEGEFQSVFQNRLIPKGTKLNASKFLSSSKPTKMLVVSDGDIIKNEIRNTARGTQVIPLGYDIYRRKEMYGNKEFLMNATNYLTDDAGLLNLRMRKSKAVLLDKVEITEKRAFWQLINVVLPLIVLLLMVLIFSFLRKKRAKI